MAEAIDRLHQALDRAKTSQEITLRHILGPRPEGSLETRFGRNGGGSDDRRLCEGLDDGQTLDAQQSALKLAGAEKGLQRKAERS